MTLAPERCLYDWAPEPSTWTTCPSITPRLRGKAHSQTYSVVKWPDFRKEESEWGHPRVHLLLPRHRNNQATGRLQPTRPGHEAAEPASHMPTGATLHHALAGKPTGLFTTASTPYYAKQMKRSWESLSSSLNGSARPAKAWRILHALTHDPTMRNPFLFLSNTSGKSALKLAEEFTSFLAPPHETQVVLKMS